MLRILFFSIPLVLLCIMLELKLRAIPNVYAYKANYVKEHGAAIKTLVFGSSHAYFGIDPYYLQLNSFSLANTSQTLDYDNLLFEKYHNSMTGLNNIIIAVSYFSLYSDLESGVEFWRSKYYKIYFKIYKIISYADNFEIEGNLKTVTDRLYKYYILHKFDKN